MTIPGALRFVAGLSVAALVLGTDPAPAALDLPAEKGGFTYELGMPPVWKGYASIEWQFGRPDDYGQMAGLFNYEVRRDLGSPVVGIAALAFSAYGGYGGFDWEGGLRGLYRIPNFYFGIGADYNFPEKETDLLLQLDLPLRRGGVFGRGTSLTVSWLPSRGNTFSLGITSPLWGRNIGQTRPMSDNVQLDPRRPARALKQHRSTSMMEALASLEDRMRWVARLNQPFAEHPGADPHAAMAGPMAEVRDHLNQIRDAFPEGRHANAEITAYHRSLDMAFTLVADSTATEPTELGRTIASRARDILLEDILIPYNRTLGQRKKNDSLLGMVAVAQTEFASWLLTTIDVADQEKQQAFYVFQTICDYMEDNRERLLERWEDNRFVWLPLQWVLTPDQHDSQTELDGLMARVVGQPFTPDNHLWYVINEQFQWEMARSVRMAEDYHVLWIHDFRGKDGDGNPDNMAFAHVINYLTALSERVRAYDDTGRMPLYMIMLDQHYFEINKSRLWLRLLRDPLSYEVNLAGEFAEWETRLAKAQNDLREAVDASLLLSVARSQYGEKWLRNLVKVHVNITNPADPSFFSWHLMGIMPIPDSMMRDHRKIAFYDVTEDDPYRGMAMFTGMGIGSHYTGASWEDRAIMIQGPGALEVKNAARELLLAQGFEHREIPYPLRERPFPRDYEDRLAADRSSKVPAWMGNPGHVMQLHSETGFHEKPINVAKAFQYSMMPAGSVLKVPDSLWQSYVYGSLLAGSALRGCKVMVISPTAETAPSNAPPTLARAHGLMGRLIVFSNELDDELAARGGLLKVGLYDPNQAVGDIAGRMVQAAETEPSWMNQVPKLHLKAQFMASGNAWEKLAARPELGRILELYIIYLADNARSLTEDSPIPDVRDYPESIRMEWLALARNLLDELDETVRQQLVYWFSVGSTNMDYRSMVMDGEVQIFVSGWQSLLGFLDFILLPGLSTWVDSTDELDALLPPPSGMTRKMAGFMKLSL
jgi:hypothetical protein